MEKLKRGNALKAAGLPLVLGAIAAALSRWRRAPDVESPVELPSMSNLPPEGSLHIEAE